MPQIIRYRPSRVRRNASLAGFVLVLVLAGVGGTYLWYIQAYSTEKVIGTAQTLKYQGKYGTAAEEVTRKYGLTIQLGERYKLALQAATIYESKRDFAEAIKWYERAIEHNNGGIGMAAGGGLGRCHEALKQYDEAARYYEKALQAVDRSADGWENDVLHYEQALKRVRGAS
jgi:tetratricopeptide (TPR) repeat protein